MSGNRNVWIFPLRFLVESRLCFMASTFICIKCIPSQLFRFVFIWAILSGRTPVRKCACSPIAAKDQHLLDSKIGHLAMSEIRSVKLLQVWSLSGCRLAKKRQGDAGTATQNQCPDIDVHKIRCQFENSLRENILKRTGDPLSSKLPQEWRCL